MCVHDWLLHCCRICMQLARGLHSNWWDVVHDNHFCRSGIGDSIDLWWPSIHHACGSMVLMVLVCPIPRTIERGSDPEAESPSYSQMTSCMGKENILLRSWRGVRELGSWSSTATPNSMVHTYCCRLGKGVLVAALTLASIPAADYIWYIRVHVCMHAMGKGRQHAAIYSKHANLPSKQWFQ